MTFTHLLRTLALPCLAAAFIASPAQASPELVSAFNAARALGCNNRPGVPVTAAQRTARKAWAHPRYARPDAEKMIIKGGSRCNWRFFSKHLMRTDQNERVTVPLLKEAVDWAVKQHGDASSRFHAKLDLGQKGAVVRNCKRWRRKAR